MPNRIPVHRPATATLPAARPTAHARGYTCRWAAFSRLYRCQHPLCVVCEAAGRVQPSECVDHITPREAGGTDDDHNLQALCLSCHARKTARHDGGYGR